MKSADLALALSFVCVATMSNAASDVVERIPALQALIQRSQDVAPAAVAEPVSVAVTQGPAQVESRCPEGFADVDHPEMWRCFSDAKGVIHHWATIYEVQRLHDNFWWGASSKVEERIVSGYAAIRAQQLQFDDWLKQNGSGLKITAIRPNGELTLGTLLIPYYKSAPAYDQANDAFRMKCAIEEGEKSDEPNRVPCTKPESVTMKSGGVWYTTVGDYPNERMAKWGKALEAVSIARVSLFDYVQNYFHAAAAHATRDGVDCMSVDSDSENVPSAYGGDCSIELDATPAAVLNTIGVLAKNLADSILRVQQLQDEYGNSPGNPENAAPRPGPAIDWVALPGGTFDMGGGPGVLPRRLVDVQGFEMSKAPITVAQYADCVRAGQCTAPATSAGDSGECNWGRPTRVRHPINCVDWDQAVQYARFQNARLPSEAEYEYAARSGGRDQRYPWGDDAPNCGRIPGGFNCGASLEHSAPVCSKPDGNTAQGLCDMAGEVMEWVQSAETAGSERIVRGSAWWEEMSADSLEVSRRGSRSYDQAYFDVGFRLARSPR